MTKLVRTIHGGCMKDLEPMLELVRGVFTGGEHRVRRSHVQDRILQYQVFVAVAVTLAFREEYLEPGGNRIRGTYQELIELFLCAGKTFGKPSAPSTYITISKKMELHDSVRVSGRGLQVTLQPPAELVQLVEELGCTEEVQAFRREALEAKARLDSERAEMAKIDETFARTLQEQAHVDDIVARLLATEGLITLRQMHDQLGEALNHPGLRL